MRIVAGLPKGGSRLCDGTSAGQRINVPQVCFLISWEEAPMV